jgi:hypothetical protein
VTVLQLADNGDFVRVLCHLHAAPDLGPGEPPKFAQVVVTYHPAPLPPGLRCTYQTPAFGPLWLASHVSRRLPHPRLLDLRLVALGYAVVFGVVVGILAASLPGHGTERVMATGAAVVVLTDFCFTCYFMSAYSEPSGFVALVAVVGLCLAYWRSDKPNLWLLAAVTVAGAVLVTSKPQYGPISAVLAPALLVRPVWARRPERRRQPSPAPRSRGRELLASRWPALLAAGILVASGALAVTGAPSDLKKIDQYQMVFVEILPHSTTPAADLRSLGLSPELARWSGSDGFEPTTATSDPAFDGFFAKTGPGAIGSFYLRHPDRALALAVRGLRASADPRVDYLGKSTSLRSGHADTGLCRFCVYSRVGQVLKPVFPVMLPLFWLGVVGLALRCARSPRRDDRAVAGAATVAVAIAIVELVTTLLGDGDYELLKHLYLADAANAVALVLAIPLIASLIRHRRSPGRRGTHRRRGRDALLSGRESSDAAPSA